MESFAEILEDELTEAVEVKNPKSLHRYILLLTQNLIDRTQLRQENSSISSDLKEITTIMRERFEAVDKRFESVDKRFEDMQHHMDKRFSTLQWFMGISFTMLAILFTIFQYI